MSSTAELVGGALVTLIGIGLTAGGEFAQASQAIAPGALLIFVGGGSLGISMARHDIRWLPGSVKVERPSTEEVPAG